MKRTVASTLSIISAVLLTSSLAAQSPEFHHLDGGIIGGSFFLDDQLGWTAEDGGRVRYSEDGGLSWQYAAMPPEIATQVQLRGIFFLDEDTGWAVGDGGVVLKSVTSTFGQMWEDANPSSRVVDSRGVPAGDPPVCTPAGYKAELYNIFMSDELNGWVVGNHGTLRRTADGGANWSDGSESPTFSLPSLLACDEGPLDVYDVHFFRDCGLDDDYSHGIISAEARMTWVTTDGGDTWSDINVVSDTGGDLCPYQAAHNLELWAMDFDDPLDCTSPGWLVGGTDTGNGYIFRTSGGGLSSTWSQLSCFRSLDTAQADFVCGMNTQYAVAALGGSAPFGLTAGYAGEVFVLESATANYDPCNCDIGEFSCNGGTVWNQKSTALTPYDDPLSHRTPIYGAAKISSAEAIMVGQFGRILRYDDAETDEVVDLATTHFTRLSDGEFISDTTGCVVGQGYIIWKTTNAGVTWSLAGPTSPLEWDIEGDEKLNAIDFSTNGTYGIAVGTGGFIAISSDSGSSWDRVTVAHLAADLNDVVFCPSSTTAYIVTSVGSVLKTTNAGSSWSLAGSGVSSYELNAVSFADTSEGYVVGDQGKVYKTLNAGSSWSAVSVTGSPTDRFNDVQTWGDGETAYIVADNGGVYKRTSSAFSAIADQDLVDLDVTANLLDIQALVDGSDVELRISGDNGVVLLRDTGTTWTQPKSQTNNPLFKLAFDDADHGFGIGLNFVVVEYD